MMYWIIGIIGAILTVWGVLSSWLSTGNVGVLLTVATGLFALLYAIFHKKINSIIPFFIRFIVATFAVIALIAMFLLYDYGNTDTATYNEAAAIVLGAGIRGEAPSLTLAKRLDKAIEYHEKNPSALIVVSGGLGKGEKYTEAHVMSRYLQMQGVDESVIIEEGASTSTLENFEFSKYLLDQKLEGDYKMVYITTDFHAFRAGIIAKLANIDANRLSSDLSWYMYPVNYLREILVVLKLFIFKI